MSDITGAGYGDKHDWENKGTDQAYYPADRSTLYTCRKCLISFRHWYHQVPNIFDQMKIRKIPEECHHVEAN